MPWNSFGKSRSGRTSRMITLELRSDELFDSPASRSLMLTPYETLKVICRRCLAGEMLKPEEMSWLGQALTVLINHRSRTIDEAMSLRASRGGVPWWREQAIRRRDAALRELARRFYVGHSVSAQARAIRMLTVRYAATGWRRDRELTAPPLYYSDAPHELLWRAFASGARMPIGERRLRDILALKPCRPQHVAATAAPCGDPHVQRARPERLAGSAT